jgi:hypothetical protein
VAAQFWIKTLLNEAAEPVLCFDLCGKYEAEVGGPGRRGGRRPPSCAMARGFVGCVSRSDRSNERRLPVNWGFVFGVGHRGKVGAEAAELAMVDGG